MSSDFLFGLELTASELHEANIMVWSLPRLQEGGGSGEDGVLLQEVLAAARCSSRRPSAGGVDVALLEGRWRRSLPLLVSRGSGRGAILLLEDGRKWWSRRDAPAVRRRASCSWRRSGATAAVLAGEGAGDWAVEEEEEKIQRMGNSGGASSGRRRQAGWRRQCGSGIRRR